MSERWFLFWVTGQQTVAGACSPAIVCIHLDVVVAICVRYARFFATSYVRDGGGIATDVIRAMAHVVVYIRRW